MHGHQLWTLAFITKKHCLLSENVIRNTDITFLTKYDDNNYCYATLSCCKSF